MANRPSPHNGRITAPHSQMPPIQPAAQMPALDDGLPDGPLPSNFNVQMGQINGQPQIRVEVVNMGGRTHIWVTPDDAEKMLNILTQVITQARTGLVIPTPNIPDMMRQALGDQGVGR